MCRSYFLNVTKDIQTIADLASRSRLTGRMIEKLGRPYTGNGRVKSGDIVPVIAPDRHGNETAFPMVWGFTGKESLIINARIENVSKSELFREEWKRHRCLVPASWYLEQEHLKINRDPSVQGTAGSQSPDDIRMYSDRRNESRGATYMLQPKNATHMFMAGLYRIEEEKDGSRFPHFVILTRNAPDDILFIHTRMPVILDISKPYAPVFFQTPEDDHCDRNMRSGQRYRRATNDYSCAPDPAKICNRLSGITGDRSEYGDPDGPDRYGNSVMADWLNPGSGPWALDRIIDSAVTDLFYDKC